jgi:hypothetical protein
MNVLTTTSLVRSALRGRALLRRGVPAAPSALSPSGAVRAGISSKNPTVRQERSFQTGHYQDHASFAVPDVVVDELDPRNFGYRVVDPFVTTPPHASLYEEDYDLYSLHVSPTQVTCTSYYVDVLGDELPDLPAQVSASAKSPSLQSRQERAGENRTADICLSASEFRAESPKDE